MHHTADIIADNDNKPEIIMFYNDTKGGVDGLDQLVHSYMCKRKTNRWPFAMFLNCLDVAGVAAFVIWMSKYPEWELSKKHKRRLFLKSVAESLIEPQVQRRASLPGLHSSMRTAIGLAGFHVAPPAPGRAAGGGAVAAAVPPTAQRARCYMCPTHPGRKQKQTCDRCKKNVCNEHSQKEISVVCNNCI